MTNPADIPPPLPWDQRAPGVDSMPGGYTGYLHSLRQICEHVVSERPSSPKLASRIQGHFELSSRYSMLVGPNPSSGRLMNRAVDQSVAVLSTEQLAELCLQHADAPLGLENYRALFHTGGAADMAPIEIAARDLARTQDLAVELCAKLAERTSAFGPLTASQLMVMLDQPDKPSSAQEIQQVLDTLASPLVGAIQGTADKGYVLASATRVIQQRLQQLGDQLAR